MSRREVPLVAGALVGYVASRCMDAATSWYYPRQSEHSRARERELSPDGTLTDLGRMMADAAGAEVSTETAGRIGLAAHRTLGTLYGVGAVAAVRRGVPPLVAGPMFGALAWVVVDEGTALPTMFEYEGESHIRGIIGHSTWGVVAGTLLALLAGRPGS